LVSGCAPQWCVRWKGCSVVCAPKGVCSIVVWCVHQTVFSGVCASEEESRDTSGAVWCKREITHQGLSLLPACGCRCRRQHLWTQRLDWLPELVSWL
jgi:hypothetical protein